MMQRVVLLGLVVFGALATLCALQVGPKIEADIYHRSIFAAAAVGVGPTMVQVSGRHVTLTGDASLRDRLRSARDAISELPGVRKVAIEITEIGVARQGTQSDDQDVVGSRPVELGGTD